MGRVAQALLPVRVLQSPLVTEAMVLSTCNRVEVYAVVDAFHGGLAVIGQVLSEYSGMSMGDLTKYAYVRYSEAAVEHLFAVASGLDSAVIGERIGETGLAADAPTVRQLVALSADLIVTKTGPTGQELPNPGAHVEATGSVFGTWYAATTASYASASATASESERSRSESAASVTRSISVAS